MVSPVNYRSWRRRAAPSPRAFSYPPAFHLPGALRILLVLSLPSRISRARPHALPSPRERMLWFCGSPPWVAPTLLRYTVYLPTAPDAFRAAILLTIGRVLDSCSTGACKHCTFRLAALSFDAIPETSGCLSPTLRAFSALVPLPPLFHHSHSLILLGCAVRYLPSAFFQLRRHTHHLPHLLHLPPHLPLHHHTAFFCPLTACAATAASVLATPFTIPAAPLLHLATPHHLSYCLTPHLRPCALPSARFAPRLPPHCPRMRARISPPPPLPLPACRSRQLPRAAAFHTLHLHRFLPACLPSLPSCTHTFARCTAMHTSRTPAPPLHCLRLSAPPLHTALPHYWVARLPAAHCTPRTRCPFTPPASPRTLQFTLHCPHLPRTPHSLHPHTHTAATHCLHTATLHTAPAFPCLPHTTHTTPPHDDAHGTQIRTAFSGYACALAAGQALF